MIDTLLYIGCGFLGGALGGYLGLGGGVLIVPFLTVITGLDIKVAAPVSVAAIVVQSVASSTEYLKKGMVDMEMVIILAIFMSMGNIAGSIIAEYIATEVIRAIFTVVLLYTAIMFLRGRQPSDRMVFSDQRKSMMAFAIILIFLAGALSALIGVGGGMMIVPLLFLIIGLPLTSARGTSSFMMGFSAAAATLVYFTTDRLELSIVPPVILGILAGGRLGGLLGTVAKPLVVRIVFFVLLLYLAYRLGSEPLEKLL